MNRPCTTATLSSSSPSSSGGRPWTLQEVLQPLPSDLVQAFGSSPVREGGPVHMSLQMLHSSCPSSSSVPVAAASENSSSSSSDDISEEEPVSSDSGDDNSRIGGHVLPMVADPNSDQSTAFHSDRAVYYQGDISQAAQAVLTGRLDNREDVSFFVGASCWSPGQLEGEIERGFWLPCRGPPEIALSGICDHEPTEKGRPRPKADLWLSMLSACGEEEAELAHLVWSDDGKDECGDPCDEFS